MPGWEPRDLMMDGFRACLRPLLPEGSSRGRQTVALLVGATALLAVWTAGLKAETMSGALALAYNGNPDLNQQRAGVRASDENIPRATAAFRPQVSATGSYGYNYLEERINGSGSGTGLINGSS